jgi:hypothetical protein
MSVFPKGSSTTEMLSYVALGVYALYAIFTLGMSGLMFSIAVGLITFSLLDSVEISTAIVILFGLLYRYFSRQSTYYQQPVKATEGFSLQDVAKRVGSIKQKAPMSTYSSPFVEGFADADSVTKGKAEGEQKATDAASAVTKPATTETKKEDEKESFESQSSGLFKLGEIPTEGKGGPHIDQGTTLMNAISSLKPEQIKAMTDDTRKLLDTQKNLMGMLNTMKPMLNDGKQLMETFQQMFGPGASPSGVAAAN